MINSKTKSFSFWRGVQALYRDGSAPPLDGQSVILAWDQPTRPRLLHFSTMMAHPERPVGAGDLLVTTITEDRFFVVCVKGLVKTVPEDIFAAIYASREGSGSKHDDTKAYVDIARSLARSLTNNLAHRTQKVQAAEAHLSSEAQVAAAERSARMREALAAHLRIERAKEAEGRADITIVQPVAAISILPDVKQVVTYEDLTPFEKLQFLCEEEHEVLRDLQSQQRPIGEIPFSERLGHNIKLAEYNTYIRQIRKELCRMQRYFDFQIIPDRPLPPKGRWAKASSRRAFVEYSA